MPSSVATADVGEQENAQRNGMFLGEIEADADQLLHAFEREPEQQMVMREIGGSGLPCSRGGAACADASCNAAWIALRCSTCASCSSTRSRA